MAADVYGPVGIFSLTGQAAQMGFIYLLQLAAIASKKATPRSSALKPKWSKAACWLFGKPGRRFVPSPLTPKVNLEYFLQPQPEISMKASRKLFLLTPLCALLAAGSAHATNGMLMEGYGPISTGMGGASQAIDHGNAGMAQNPATLGMMADGTARLDVAFGILGPDVNSSMPAFGMSAKSGGTSYLMPAFGYTRRSGALTYGLGMFAQGGMGTEYDATSFLAMGSGSPVRSELGVGNVIFPVAYQVNSNLTVGATLKFMWSSLDMRMAASGAQLAGMVTGASGNIAGALAPLGGAPWARIDFSDSNDFTGAAKSTGFGAALGMTYKVNKDVTMGASYQFKSALDDMKTAASDASMTAFGGFVDNGQITVIDFQMPSVFAVGGSWLVSGKLLAAGAFDEVTRLAREAVEIVARARGHGGGQ